MQKFYAFLSLSIVAMPALADYDINFPADTRIAGGNNRIVSAVGFGDNTVNVPQASDLLLYHDLSSSAVFEATAGEPITPVIQWGGTYMHGYFYADFNADGAFDYPSDLYSFSYYQGKNSLGLSVNSDCNVTLHPFVVPASLPAGDYRVRFLVDWDACDPGGRADDANPIVKNNGAIVDATLRVAAAAAPSTQYAVNYPENTVITNANNRYLSAVRLTQPILGTQTVNVGQGNDKLLYHDCTETELKVLAGAKLQFDFDYNGNWMNSYIYIDCDGNGDFSAHVGDAGVPVPGTDLMAFSHLGGKNSLGQSNNGSDLHALPAFTLPADLAPGKYRCRAKIDWDSADPAGGETILKDGGSITDFILNVVDEDLEPVDIRLMPLNGIITMADGAPVPETYAGGYGLEIKAVASLPGFTADRIIVRHGTEEDLTDTEITLNEDGTASIPGDIVSGSVTIFALFQEQPDSEWTKIWGDEFNSDALNKTTWSYHPRYSSTWNRFCAQGDAEGQTVNTFGNGYYNAWCVPTDKAAFPNEEKNMISGAIYTGGKFTFHYGRIEARIKTNPYRGNFPAFWLMPASNAEGGWPRSGEIDIWEQIDASDRAHSTVHTGWTGWRNYCGWTEGPKQSSPANSGNVAVNDVYTWHYYALEWDAEELRWYVDGKHTFTYKNMHYSEPGTNYTEQICWPFYKDFYVILNQSVGDGSWAASADLSHTYLTQFDYVRVYQKKGENTYTSPLVGNGDDPDFFTPLGEGAIVSVEVPSDTPAVYYDLQGRRVANPSKGIYVSNGKKVLF